MKKTTYLFALALGTSTLTYAQNVGINTDGSDPDANTILHINNHSGSSLDSALLRIENEKSTSGTGVQIHNSGQATTTAQWDIIVPGSSTDLRIKGNGSDHITIQNDGDVGIGTTSPVSGLDIQTSMGLAILNHTDGTDITLDNTHNVVLCNNGPYTVNLPAAASNTGKVYYIKNIDTDGDDITIDGNSTETIDGSETYILSAENDVIRVISDGSNWVIIEKSVAFECGTDDVTFTYNGSSVTYGTALSSTGKCWLDRNLGATRVALNKTDHLAYGDLFQWGRADDGHQVINWTSSSASDNTEQGNETTTISSSTSPGSEFILVSGNWYNGPNPDDLWKEDGTGVNNPCPDGFRLPTLTEWNTEKATWVPNAAGFDGAFGSVLKLPTGARRNHGNGNLEPANDFSGYWSSTPTYLGTSTTDPYAETLNYYGQANHSKWFRASGYFVRCLKE